MICLHRPLCLCLLPRCCHDDREKFGWTRERVDELLKPVLQVSGQGGEEKLGAWSRDKEFN